ncbi:MAG TPA: hypothetical protein VKO87_02140 [Gemmatimonadaceae bacterium]|nr:hypothetical protein [Gemmatimonadaceae bacterium]
MTSDNDGALSCGDRRTSAARDTQGVGAEAAYDEITIDGPDRFF